MKLERRASCLTCRSPQTMQGSPELEHYATKSNLVHSGFRCISVSSGGSNRSSRLNSVSRQGDKEMETEDAKEQFSRRGFLGVGSAALAAALGALSVSGAAAQEPSKTQKAAGDRSKSDPGPANPELDGQNPDSIWPPSTDSKSLVQTFKYPFSFA